MQTSLCRFEHIIYFVSFRCLLNTNTAVPLIKDFGVLKAIGYLLIKYHKDWQRATETEEVLRCIIKVLCGYSKYHYKGSINEVISSAFLEMCCFGQSIIIRLLYTDQYRFS